MDPVADFVELFESLYGQYTQLLQITAQPAPPNISNPQNLTVGEYLAVLDQMEDNLEAIPRFTLRNILNNNFYDTLITGEAREFVEHLSTGNYAAAFTLFDQARDIVDGYPSTMVMSDAITDAAENGGGDTGGGDTGGGDTGGGDTGGGDTGGGDTGGGDTGGGDTGGGDSGGGDTGGGDTGGGDTELIEAFEQLQDRLDNLLWSEQGEEYSSPTFNVDETSGAWVSLNTSPQSIGGGSLEELYEENGEAIALAILDYVGAQQPLLSELSNADVDQGDLNSAISDVATAAEQLLALLQGMGAALTDADTTNPTDPAGQAAAAMQALLDALETALPELDGDLDGIAIGSRNSNPSFLFSPDASADGTEHGDWYMLSKSDDSFDGGAGTDVLFGLEGDDSLNGGADDDVLMGGKGDDDINGGAGDGDVAGFSGGMGRYTLKLSSDGSIEVEDRASDGDGTDTLTNVESLSFAEGATIFTDGTLDLSIIQGITGLDQAEISTFIELYIAYFNRAPDALGLYFWGSAFASGTTLEESAALFLDQDETRATYPSDLSNLDFANQVYSNVLGREADAAGRDFWVGQLDSGNVDRGTFILEVLKGAKADPAPDADQDFIDLQTADRAFLADKTDIGTYFAAIKGLSDVDDASAAMQLYVRGDSSSIQTAVDRIDQDYSAALADDSGELLLQLVGVADDPFAV